MIPLARMLFGFALICCTASADIAPVAGDPNRIYRYFLHYRATHDTPLYLYIRDHDPKQYAPLTTIRAGTDVGVSVEYGPYYKVAYFADGDKYVGVADKTAFVWVGGPVAVKSDANHFEPEEMAYAAANQATLPTPLWLWVLWVVALGVVGIVGGRAVKRRFAG